MSKVHHNITALENEYTTNAEEILDLREDIDQFKNASNNKMQVMQENFFRVTTSLQALKVKKYNDKVNNVL